ncbi:uncharacterized protein LOC111681089 [Lucilia cuprina]|uniref:uncharacterized protein LOC111681089 n=1 Tax=Lucilia cuprina TaxID=7375 RepID=UPI001F055FA1|nr:uncharacterized protein LOC111681089 [Lucilia cuprina]
MENNEFLQNNAKVEIEPKQNFHFRYERDINQGKTHGILNGQNEDYPKLKLLLPENGAKDEWGNQRDFYVLCSLHCNDNNKPLSPHLLMIKGKTAVNYRFIFEKMETSEHNTAERFWKLKDYVIVRLQNKQYKKSLENKQSEFAELGLPFDFKRLLGPLKLDDRNVQDSGKLKDDPSIQDSGKLNVCLGFTIFEKDFYNNTYSLYRDPIYTCNIYHGDDLKIKKLCNIKGSIRGGTEITILIRFESNLPLNVLIKKIKKNTNETEWFREVQIHEEQKFQKAAITFNLPSYDGPHSDKEVEIEVYMCVVVRDTTYKSDSVKFYYINENSYKRRIDEDQCNVEYNGKKKKSSDVSNDSADLPSAVHVPVKNVCSNSEKIKSQIDLIFSKAEDGIYYKNMDYVFYDALENRDTLIHLYTKANETKQQNLIVDFRNRDQENLLHWACKMDYSKSIRPLIGLGCHINQQNMWGRTPLHIALTERRDACISEIQLIFKNYLQYSENVKKDLINMLKTYNHNGYTVLHEAVLNRYYELFEIMLIFMTEHNLNILDYEVLGSGDSIAHLAAKNNTLMDIDSIIMKYIPNYMSVKNYAGIMVKDLNEMFSEKLSI